MRRYGLIAVLSAAGAAAGAPDPMAVLQRVIAKVRDSMQQIPNYACVETVTRDYYRAIAPVERACDVLVEQLKHPTLDMRLRHVSTDRLRLDVAMASRGELHSWVGASKFDDRPIDTLVPEGPLGTGAFAAHLTVLFSKESSRLRFLREVAVDGRPRLEFAFDVPQADSQYRVKVGNSWIYTAYSGSIQVDPAKDEVTQLRVETAFLPPASGMCRSTTVLDLGMAAIGSRRFLFPTRAEQQFLSNDANQAVNTLTFSGCREYRGESSISFETDGPLGSPGAPSKRAGSPETAAIPGGLNFTIELADPIDTATAAAGDPFSARLAGSLRDIFGKTLARKGARVEGRIIRMAVYDAPKTEAILVLRPESVETSDGKHPLHAVQDLRRAVKERTRDRKVVILLPFQWETNAGLFRFPGERTVVRKGFVTEWRTVGQ